jgi:hypothetical protein
MPLYKQQYTYYEKNSKKRTFQKTKIVVYGKVSVRRRKKSRSLENLILDQSAFLMAPSTEKKL